ncbi:MAG: smalltalk protein [Prevotella sp.]|nr:smalltalk protein [Prevotella sp.]
MNAITVQFPWKKILEIVVAVLTAIIGTLSLQSCIG